MITPEQEAWINTLSDKIISISPYDPQSQILFERIQKKIHSLLGEDVTVEQGGSTIFGIAGQNEVDVSIVVPKEKFPEYISKLEAMFGSVQSNYPDRARFEVKEDGKKIDLKIIDVNHPNYIQGKAFEDYLKEHPEDVESFRILKEECNGLTVKEYHRKKTEFINEILTEAWRTRLVV